MDAANYLEGFSPPHIPGLLSLTSGSKKQNKRNELDVRSLTLWHTKDGGAKH